MKKSKLNLTLPLATTFILMVMVVIYTSTLFYRISVSNIYEVGADKISGISASLGNYLETSKGVLWVTADTVDFMVRNGESNALILDYLTEETGKHKTQFDHNYTGLYGYISGEYLDGLGWIPPEDYVPTERDWYKIAAEADGELVIVPPYVDAQTGSMVISFSRLLSDGENVVSLDLITNHVQDIISATSIKGKGYGFILDKDGTVIAHPHIQYNGMNFGGFSGGAELMKQLHSSNDGRFEAVVDGEKCTVFTDMIMDQWHLVIVVENDELFKDVHTQLVVNIITNLIVFALIALFYYIAYRNEQKSAREAEALKISEQQKVYEAELLRLEKSAADSANKAKGEFLAQMSHEIRTPINAVLGMNEMILRESDDENILDYAGSIRTAGKTLLSLINSILDFSKIEDGKMEIVPVKYDTVSMINNLINSVSKRAKSKELAFIVHADPQLPCAMIGDDVRVSQVIVNLLTNAVKYTEKGSVTLNIACKERTDSSVLLKVAVRDTGIGIRKEDMEKLFESFSRLEVTRNRNIEGTGLGMAIVTKLLSLMDSKLDVESVYGEGSVFSFELRQEIADASPIGTALERRTDLASRTEKEFRHYEGARVLVTDDNEMNLKVAKNLLKLFGIQPDLAISGEKTVELMRENVYDIVFLDHMMPDMDGIETLAQLREETLIPEGAAIIALTANAVIGARDKYLAAGFDNYLSKPISLEELADILAEYLSEYAENKSAAQQPEEEEIMEFLPDDEDSEIMEFSPETDAADAEDDITGQLEAEGISTESGLKYCGGDADFYRHMLKDYADTCEKRLQELRTALEADDLRQYQTLVHALKSVSKTVGADDVSELARSLEEAAEKGDAAFVSSHHAELETLYGRKTAALNTILPADENEQ